MNVVYLVSATHYFSVKIKHIEYFLLVGSLIDLDLSYIFQ